MLAFGAPGTMAQAGPVDLAALVRNRPPGRSLATPFYASPEVFAADLELIWRRHWLFVAVEAEIPEPGDYRAIEIDRSSIVIVRDDEGEVRAFRNVCRHRGARLVSQPSGTVGKLVCPYHSWTYELDGRLLWAEHMGASFDPSCHGLKPVHLRSLEGLIFVCLAEGEPPAGFAAMTAVMRPYLAPHGLRETKVAKQVDIVEEGNWKLTMENNRECYHCAANHPELTVSLFAEGFGYAPEGLDEAGRAQADRYDQVCAAYAAEWEGMGLPHRLVEHMDDRPTGFRAQRLVLDKAGEAHTLDSAAACRKLMGSLKTARMGALHYWAQPNFWSHFMADHAITFSVLPLAPDRTLLRTTWLVHRDAIEGVDYDVDHLTAVWTATNDQDSALVGLAHRGVEDPGYVPGPYSPHTEALVEANVAWYVRRLAEGLGIEAPAEAASSPLAA